MSCVTRGKACWRSESDFRSPAWIETGPDMQDGNRYHSKPPMPGKSFAVWRLQKVATCVFFYAGSFSAAFVQKFEIKVSNDLQLCQ